MCLSEHTKRQNFIHRDVLQILHCAGVAACGAAEDAGGGGAVGGVAGEMHGGAQAAAEGGERDGRDELMCGSCSAKACGKEASCPLHSDQYVEFKCRFCCSIATFFCFGHTHFCEKCHLKVSVASCADCFTLREHGGGGAFGLAAIPEVRNSSRRTNFSVRFRR